LAYSALFDACALFPNDLRDLFLRLGEERLYRTLWSDDILAEMERNILRVNPHLTSEKLARTVSLMREYFPEATVTGHESLIDVMTNTQHDRHVLAAAVRGRADVIVTSNIKHFPPDSVEPYDLDVQTPDQFLLHQFHLAPNIVMEALAQQAADNARPPQTVPDLLDLLARYTPEFADAVRSHTRAGQDGAR